MRDYVQTNAKQALEHEQWFAQQVQTTRQALKTGKQSSAPASAVHAWLESWGTDAETAAPGARSKAKTQAKFSKSTNTPDRKRA
jgi:hypothetical protein